MATLDEEDVEGNLGDFLPEAHRLPDAPDTVGTKLRIGIVHVRVRPRATEKPFGHPGVVCNNAIARPDNQQKFPLTRTPRQYRAHRRTLRNRQAFTDLRECVADVPIAKRRAERAVELECIGSTSRRFRGLRFVSSSRRCARRPNRTTAAAVVGSAILHNNSFWPRPKAQNWPYS